MSEYIRLGPGDGPIYLRDIMIKLLTREEPVATPPRLRQTADLSTMEAMDVALRKAIEDKKVHDAYIEDLKDRIRAAMGDAEEAKIHGVLRYTYAKAEAYAWAQFKLAHPQIAEDFMVTVEKQVLDTDRLIKEHPALVAEFQTRSLLVK